MLGLSYSVIASLLLLLLLFFRVQKGSAWSITRYEPMQCLMLNLLTLHSNVNCLYCTPTIIASFTSVFSSFTSVNVGKLQYTAVCTLTTGDIDPKHSWLRDPRCITNETCIMTFNNKLIFDWLNGYRHCNFKGHLICLQWFYPLPLSLSLSLPLSLFFKYHQCKNGVRE